MALAMAKGQVINKFQEMRKTVTEVVGFANILDAYNYLGAAQITIQNRFGVSYVEDFMGYRTLFLLSESDILCSANRSSMSAGRTTARLWTGSERSTHICSRKTQAAWT